MKYESLRKLYYKDPKLYQQEYDSRWNGRAAIHIDFDVSGKPAFFEENNEVILLAFQIMTCDKKILSISKDLPPIALQQYRKKCLIDEIVLTNKIEGVHSSRKEIGETLAVLDEQSAAKGKHHRFIGLVNKYTYLWRRVKISGLFTMSWCWKKSLPRTHKMPPTGKSFGKIRPLFAARLSE